jgi:hypothetical protein
MDTQLYGYERIKKERDDQIRRKELIEQLKKQKRESSTSYSGYTAHNGHNGNSSYFGYNSYIEGMDNNNKIDTKVEGGSSSFKFNPVDFPILINAPIFIITYIAYKIIDIIFDKLETTYIIIAMLAMMNIILILYIVLNGAV